mgnify:FL=1
MKKVGIVLIVLEVIALAGSVYTGNTVWMQGGSYALGYFLPAIIGIILIIKANSKAKKEEKTEETYKTKSSTGSDKRFCPKCGTPAEEGDAFCIQCGSPLKGGK